MAAVIGKYRPAKNVKPGWHVRLEDEDGGWKWHKVDVIAESENIFTGRKSITFYCDGGANGQCGRGDEVMCRNLAEVRRATEEGS